MRAVVIYESLTGNTAKAAQLIGSSLVGAGRHHDRLSHHRLSTSRPSPTPIW